MSVHTIGNDRLVARVSSKGGQLVGLVLDGEEYLWQGDPTVWKGQAPVLFPIVGTLREGCATSANGTVTLGRHGLARDYEHEVLEAADDHVTFELRASDETRARFPFDFALRMTYTVRGTTLEQAFEVENTGDVTLPFVVGGHPAFNVPARRSGERFDEYVVRFAGPWSWSCPDMDAKTGLINWDDRRMVLEGSDTLPVTHELFARDALVFEDVPERSVTLEGPLGHGVRVDFEGFDYLGIWSASAVAPFVAIEPWRGIATCTDESDVFEEKRGMSLLAPGKVERHAFSITPF